MTINKLLTCVFAGLISAGAASAQTIPLFFINQKLTTPLIGFATNHRIRSTLIVIA